MTEIRPLFQDRQPGPDTVDVTPELVKHARAISAICATRMLLMVAVLTGAAIWLWVAYTPTDLRLYVACAYSVVFVGPQVLLYYRRG